MDTLAHRAVEARLAAGYQEGAEWARALGITPQAIYQIESGKTVNLGAKTMAAMERLSGLRGEWIRTGQPPKRTEAGHGAPAAVYEAQAFGGAAVTDPATIVEIQQILAALVQAMAQHRPAEAADVGEALAPLIAQAKPGSLLSALAPRLARAQGWRAAK